jgi:hypothetical protein
VGFAGDVEATVVWVTTWRRAERFRTLATRRWCLDGDLTRGVSGRSSLAIALAAALTNLVGATVSPLVAVSRLDRMGVGGRLAVPPS